MEYIEVEFKNIIIPEVRARSRLTDEQKAFLAASKAKYGSFDPILVRALGGDKYELIDGENRLKEDMGKGLERGKVLVTDMPPKDAAMVNLLSNVARGTQDPIGAARALKLAMDQGASEEEMAAITSHTVSWVRKTIGLLELPEIYQKALEEGTLKVGHIDEVMRLPNSVEMDAALQTALRLGWTASTLKNYVDNRMVDLRVAESSGDKELVKIPPLPQRMEQMARYRQCMVCARMVPADEIRLPTCCGDCFNLARYCVDQMGEPKKAMEEIFKAIDFYRSYQRFEIIKKGMETKGPGLTDTEKPPT